LKSRSTVVLRRPANRLAFFFFFCTCTNKFFLVRERFSGCLAPVKVRAKAQNKKENFNE
jgi:hypothetical protein